GLDFGLLGRGQGEPTVPRRRGMPCRAGPSLVGLWLPRRIPRHPAGVIGGTPPEWTGDPRVSGEIAYPRRRLASPTKPLHRAHRPRNLTVVRIAARVGASGSLV